MPWELEDAAAPAALAAGGQWSLEAPPPEAVAAPWWQRLGTGAAAGFRHRQGVEGERAAFASANPVFSAAMAGNPALALAPIPRDWLNKLMGQAPSEQEQRAAAATRQQDTTDAPNVQGIAGALGYGIAESPETLFMPQLRALKGAGLLAKVGNAALTGAGQGGYSALQNNRDIGQSVAHGAAGGGAFGALGGAAGKIWNAARGVWEDAGAQAADQLAKRIGVKATVGDLAPESGWRQTEDVAAFIPGSKMKASRKAQAEALAGTYQALHDDVRAPIAHLLDAGMTPEEIVANSARRMQAAHAGAVRALANDIPGDTVISPTQFVPALQAFAADYGADLGGVQIPNSVRSIVEGIVSPKSALTDLDQGVLAFARGNMPLAERMSPGITQRMTPVAPDLTAAQAHTLQSEMGSVIRALETQAANGTITRTAPAALGQVRDALLADMDQTAAVSEPFRAMQQYFRKNALPYRDENILRSLVEPGATGEGLFNKLNDNDFAKASTLMGALDPEGQAALRFGVLSKAGNKAVTDNQSSGVSTAKLAKAFDVGTEFGQKRQMAEMFTPAQIEQMNTLRDVSQLARRASTWAHNPHTGVQNIPVNAMKLAWGMLGSGGAKGAAGNAPLAALSLVSPSLSGRAITALSSSPAFKNAYFGKAGLGGADPILQALAAQAAAGQADSNAPTLLDYLGM